MTRTKTPNLYDYDYWLFLIWLLLLSMTVFALVVSWNEGYLFMLSVTDKSRVSLLIAALFAIGTIHCAARSLYLSRQLLVFSSLQNQSSGTLSTQADGSVTLGNYTFPAASLAGQFLRNQNQSSGNNSTGSQDGTGVDLLIAKTKSNHDIGWHLVDVLLKLGLIGTIVGFILMLGSVANTESLDVESMQTVLKQMSSGMGTALFTTLVGMTCSIILGLQYLFLDKASDLLIERTIELSEQLESA